MVSAAAAAAVIASISTPVWPVVRASATRTTSVSPSDASTSTNESGSGWQSGISSAVRFAAWIPAIRAVPTTSPFGASPRAIAAAVSADIRTVARARARRSVTGLSPTSTIRARPASSRCVSSSDRLVGPPCRGDQVADRSVVATPQQLDGVRVAVDDRLEEGLAVLVGRKRRLGPATHLVEEQREPRVGLPILLGDLVADPLGQRRRGTRGRDGDRERPGAD